jgi:hypothetical protein
MHGMHPRSRADALQLTALTNLTKLVVSDAWGVDDTAVTALAVRLTNLQELRLMRCKLCSSTVLPVIASLTGLTNLVLTINQHVVDLSGGILPLGREDLLLLAPLTQLKKFMSHNLFSEEAMRELWDAGRQQWQQQL